MLDKTIQSLLSELKNLKIEIIIVDGGSTDGTIDYIENLNKLNKKIKIIKHGELRGTTNVFNDSLKISNGKYIYYLPSIVAN